jgi:hypothetical protein
MKMYGDMDAQIHVLFTSALGAGQWSASRFCRFTPGERPTVRGWVDPRAGLNDKENWKFLTLLGVERQPLEI